MGVGSAHAASLPLKGHTKVASVDGPGRLTITAQGGRRKVAIRLLGVDTPEPGQCGAAQSEAALRGLVRKTKRKSLTYALQRDGHGGYAKDEHGRLLARVIYRHSYEVSGLGDRLISSGWARLGTHATLDDPVIPADAGLYVAGHDPTLPGHAPVGLWTTCGGYVHAATTVTTPPAPAPVWTITAEGVTTAIGPVVLPTGAAAVRTFTFSSIAARFPLELRRLGTTCLAAVPSLQIELRNADGSRAAACGPQPIAVIYSQGPGVPATDTGLHAADAATAITPLFPLAEHSVSTPTSQPGNFVRLAGDASASPWQTIVPLNANDRVQGFAAFAAKPADDR